MKKKKSLFRKAEIYFFATRRLLDIRSSSDPEGTIRDIEDNIALKGYNIWILVCSALLASIGLDTNSTAVIIGAMLISPLMSPILGIGLGLGINDWHMFERALRNLGVATFASLLASFIYFNITPYGEPTSEIMSRTYPTFLDVLVALFGGIAGIVSNSRSEKTNAIPGVAIATALMPPVCASGYGLATLNWGIFLGAFYLFFINAVFISTSTYIIVKYLNFPLHREPDEKTQRFVNRVMTFFLIIVISPSIYFLYTVVYRSQKIQQLNKLIEEVTQDITRDNAHEVLNVERPKTANELEKIKTIKMYVSGEQISDSIKEMYAERFRRIGDYKFRMSTINSVRSETIEEMSYNTSATRESVLDLRNKYDNLDDSVRFIYKVQDELIQAQEKAVINEDLQKELSVFYPDLLLVEIIDSRTQAQKEAAIYRQLELDEGLPQNTRVELEFAFWQRNNFPFVDVVPMLFHPDDPAERYFIANPHDIKPINFINQPSFPFFNLQLSWDTLSLEPKEPRFLSVYPKENFPFLELKNSLEDLQNYAQENQESENTDPNLTDVLLDAAESMATLDPVIEPKRPIEVNLTWYQDFKVNKLKNQDKNQLIHFLELKLNPDPIQDTLIINNLVSTPLSLDEDN